MCSSILLTIIAVLFFWKILLPNIPSMLSTSDEPSQADCIVVLSGDCGNRINHAVSLLQQGFADKLVISGGPIYQNVTAASLMKEHAMSLGLPEDRIILQELSCTTAEDAVYTVKILQDRGFKKVIVVTSFWHSRRAMSLFEDQETSIEFLSCPCPPEWVGNWWQDPATTRSIVSELLKFIWGP